NEPGLKATALSSEMNVDAAVIDRLMDKLLEAQLIVRSEEHLLTPAKPLDQIGLADLLQVIRAPDSELVTPSYTAALQHSIDEALEAAFKGRTLEDWVRQNEGEETD
ncbi:MAG: hypothetical protein ACKVLK_17220, partial [Spongiibacter sp.]